MNERIQQGMGDARPRPTGPIRRHPTAHERYFDAVVESDDLTTWIRPVGDLTIASTEQFEATADVPLSPGHHVVVDLSGLKFIDSTGLSVLLTLSRNVRANGCGFSLDGAHGPVERTLELVNMTTLLAAQS